MENKTPSGRPNVLYLPLANQNLPNPFRPDSMKAKAFELFRAGGRRKDLIEAIKKLGATRATASSWLQFFRVYVRGGREALRALRGE